MTSAEGTQNTHLIHLCNVYLFPVIFRYHHFKCFVVVFVVAVVVKKYTRDFYFVGLSKALIKYNTLWS